VTAVAAPPRAMPTEGRAVPQRGVARPGERPGERARPRLRVAPAPRRHVRLAVALGAVVTVASLFAVVALHALLAQGQFALERLRDDMAAEELRYEQLRLEVAQLASPSQVVAAARELGLVEPDVVEYIDAPEAAPPATPTGPTTSVLPETWSDGKASLDAAG
jgi:hypothetical protein